MLVAPPDPDDRYNSAPVMTGEHPSQCYVFTDPTNPNNRMAAIKRWADDWDNHAYATIWLADTITQFRSERPITNTASSQEITIYDQRGEPIPSTLNKLNWTQTSSGPNEIGVVPMVAVVNNPDLLEGGSSDLVGAIPIQDAVNKYCLDMQVSSEFHAYPQRWATGWERAVDSTGHELTGREVEVMMAATRMVRAESKETSFGSFAPGDVNNYILPIELYIDHLAAQTQTPVYYLKGKLANLSADAMHAADQGLVDRVKGKILNYSDPWEEIMRVAFLAVNDQKRGHAQSAEVIWADPESKSLAVVVQAAVQMRQALNVPIEMSWELLGWSPQKIRQARDSDEPPHRAGRTSSDAARARAARPERSARQRVDDEHAAEQRRAADADRLELPRARRWDSKCCSSLLIARYRRRWVTGRPSAGRGCP